MAKTLFDTKDWVLFENPQEDEPIELCLVINGELAYSGFKFDNRQDARDAAYATDYVVTPDELYTILKGIYKRSCFEGRNSGMNLYSIDLTAKHFITLGTYGTSRVSASEAATGLDTDLVLTQETVITET